MMTVIMFATYKTNRNDANENFDFKMFVMKMTSLKNTNVMYLYILFEGPCKNYIYDFSSTKLQRSFDEELIQY